MTTTQQTTLTVRPFQVSIDQAVLDDLHDRLARTRFATPAPGDSWDYGTPESYMREMVACWHGEFDWRAQEERMNAFPHFRTEIDGQTIHFIHVRSSEPDATPLLLGHTYPGSFVDFLDLIGLLTDPVAHGGRAEDAFDVVIPSMVGFGFSTPVVDGGWTMARLARTWDTLMRGLGYESYGTHGRDGGAMISRELAVMDPPGFLGAHVLQLFSFPSGDPRSSRSSRPPTTRPWSSSAGSSSAPASPPRTRRDPRPSPPAWRTRPSRSSRGTSCSRTSATGRACSLATRCSPRSRCTG